jgi:hypothetical protein
MRARVVVFCLIVVFIAPALLRAQDPSPWMLMSDGVLVAMFNHQGGPRGGDELKSTNWWMGMASRPAGKGRLTLTGMLSLDPATTTAHGYREIFQAGEVYRGQPLVDWQHPHDLLMQASIVWRVPLDYRTGFTIAGAPVGEPALGPIAFMHRPSAAENPAAPLGHHTFDSTHIAMGVITAALDRGPFTIEASLFRGGEPDDNRWDLMDPGALDSWSARAWYEPSADWQFQISHGFLKEPETHEPGNIRRTTGSGSWFKRQGEGFAAATVAIGRNDTEHGAFHAFLAELTRRRASTTTYGRFESVQKETALLLGGEPDAGDHHDPASRVDAYTVGVVRDVSRWRGFETGIGADVTFYRVPPALRSPYGRHPKSVHVFLRVRPPAGHMGRMWNMRMSKPM